jgi:hypothetical protein
VNEGSRMPHMIRTGFGAEVLLEAALQPGGQLGDRATPAGRDLAGEGEDACAARPARVRREVTDAAPDASGEPRTAAPVSNP